MLEKSNSSFLAVNCKNAFNSIKNNIYTIEIVSFIILLGLILRLVGVNHGYPFIFHPDEPTVVRSTLALFYNINPHHFDWPHFYYYLNFPFYLFIAKLRPLLIGDIWHGDFAFYVVSRTLSAFFGAFTAIPIYLSAKQLFNKKAALLSVILLMVLPLHVWNSHYTLIDVPMVFWYSWGIFYASKIVTGSTIHSNYLLAGMFFGLAASTKYNGALGFLFVVLAAILSSKISVKSFVNIIISGCSLLFGFLIGTPFALLDVQTFLIKSNANGALWQFTNVGKVVFVTHITQLYTSLTYTLPDDFGYTILIAFFALCAFFSFKIIKYRNFDTRLAFLLIPTVIFIYYISGFEKVRSHYFFITYASIVLAAGYVLSIIYNKYRRIGLMIIIIAITIPSVISISNDIKLTRQDTRVELYNWLTQNLKETDVLIYNSGTLKPVIEKTDHKLAKKSSDTTYMIGTRGYLVYYTGDNNQPEFTSNKNVIFNQVISFSAEGRTGNSILIYTFDGLSKNANN